MFSYTYSGRLWLPFLVAVFVAFLGWYAWRQRNVPGAVPLIVGCLFAVAWCLGSLLQSAVVEPAGKLFWLRFSTVWQLPVVTTATCFALQYSGLGRWLTRRTVALLAVPPLVFGVLILTDGVHHLVWKGFVFAGAAVDVIRGPANVVFLSYSYVLFVLNIAILGWLFVTSPRYRAPVTMLVLGQVGARVLFAIGTRGGFLSQGDSDPFVLAVVFGLYAVAIFRFHALDPVPTARAAAIDQMLEGMVVVDPRGRIVHMNRAAEKTLGEPGSRLRGRSLVDLLPLPGSLDGREGGLARVQFEFDMGSQPMARRYRARATPLRHEQGEPLGHLLLLEDVTEENEARARLLEEQGVVATYRERERLARELHDGIGQVLGFVSMQAQAARESCRHLDQERTDFLLARLVEVSQRAHDDLRHSILSLKATPEDGPSFLSGLRRHLDDFRQHYGLEAELTVDEAIGDEAIAPAAAAQLLRVVQEALSNTRHADAHAVSVTVEKRDHRACITLCDDGRGFDPATAAGEPGRHFGLAFMGERMEQIGGKLTIESAAGRGTRVVLEAPLQRPTEEPR